jgi:tRNA (adenine22-N1)-methyltransferase
VKRAGRDRREALIALCPRQQGWIVVDVGADHGHVAHAVGAIAVERAPNRIGRRDVAWVVSDGLTAFRRVDVAIIAGMGACTIASILARGPAPIRAAVVHAADDPQRLRLELAGLGWRIEAERLAREGHRIAEVARVVPGIEEATGHRLRFGPRLLEGDDPLLEEHLTAERERCMRIAERTRDRDPTRHAEYASRVSFLGAILGGRASSL